MGLLRRQGVLQHYSLEVPNVLSLEQFEPLSERVKAPSSFRNKLAEIN